MVDDDAVGNRFVGVARHILQARDVYGDVHFHDATVDPVRPPVFMVPAETERVIARPELLEQVVEQLSLADGASVVAIAGIGGAGGFGKTTLTTMVCRDPRVRSRFEEVLWLTIGEQTEGSDLAAKINDLAAHLTVTRPSYVDPQQAGHFLCNLLRDRPRLLVLDDVWRTAQLEPFLVGGDQCVRLLTTRLPAILPASSSLVIVDQMTPAQAEELLLDGLPVAAGVDVGDLLRRTGRWPVLLRLTNGAIRRLLRTGASVDTALRWVVDQLRSGGPVALDTRNADQRTSAVAATVDASLRLLAELDDRWLDRFLDLAVFPEDTPIPLTVLRVYWARRGGLTDDESLRLCLDLRDLSLVERFDFGGRGEVRLHDVIREYLWHRTVDANADLHRDFVEAYRTSRAAWWELAAEEEYLAGNLGFHLAEAGLEDELTSLVCDPRWLAVVLCWFGPPAAESDLARSPDRTAAAIAEAVRQNAHLLGPIEPDEVMLPLLLSRLGCDGRLADLVREQIALLRHDHLMPSKPLPDAPHPAIVRTIQTNETIHRLATSPTGNWFATANDRAGQLRLWNIDGTQRATLETRGAGVTAFAISPDGRWLAAVDRGRRKHADERRENVRYTELRLWRANGERIASLPLTDTITRDLAWNSNADWLVTSRLEFIDRNGKLTIPPRPSHQLVRPLIPALVAVSPDSTIIAVADRVTVWLFDRFGQPTNTFAGHTDRINDMAFGPGGQWIATASDDGTVRITALDGTSRTLRNANMDAVLALSIAPDGQRVATVERTGHFRLWSIEGVLQATVDVHSKSTIHSVAFTQDGRRLITGDELGTARIWDVDIALQQPRSTPATLTTVLAISPDGAWMVGADDTGVILLFDRVTDSVGRLIRTPDGNPRIEHMCVSGDGQYLVGVGGSLGGNRTGKVFIWAADGTEELDLPGHTGPVLTATVSPDSTWFVTDAMDGTLRFWDRTGSPRAVIAEVGWVLATAVSPDSKYVASGHDGGDIRIWKSDGTERTRLAADDHGVPRTLAISADSTTIISGHSQGTICIWTLTGDLVGTLKGHKCVSGLALSPDDRWLASVGNDGVIRIWDWRTRKCHAATRVDRHLDRVYWMPDSRHVIASGNSGVFEFSFCLLR